MLNLGTQSQYPDGAHTVDTCINVRFNTVYLIAYSEVKLNRYLALLFNSIFLLNMHVFLIHLQELEHSYNFYDNNYDSSPQDNFDS